MEVEGVFPAKGKRSSTQHNGGRKSTWSPSLPPLPGEKQQRMEKNWPSWENKSPSGPLSSGTRGRERPQRPSPSALPLQQPAVAHLGTPNQQASGTAPPRYLWKRMDFTRVTTSRLALCPAHTIATCRSCPETNSAFETGHPTTPCRGLSAPPWGNANGKRLHNPALLLGEEPQREVGDTQLGNGDQESGCHSCLAFLSGEVRQPQPPTAYH